MKDADIARILGISKAAVSKIKHGNKHFSKFNIEKVKYYKKFEMKMEEIFKDEIFIRICDVVIDNAKSRDCKNITQLKRFAVQCKIWGKTLRDDNKEFQSVPSLTNSPEILFVSDDMLMMLDIALKRTVEKEVIEKAAMLYNLSNNLNKRLKK
jgi:predicted transcriptional regulator